MYCAVHFDRLGNNSTKEHMDWSFIVFDPKR